ncbi:hypothetical protein LSCM1_03774 [Leishmania martiniquensis]|uniref:Protein kinase domain-containing protein n=1 Tax=Leishmania martiniquensis TaxID=1580590 RepID=A0A836H8L3_9TRYP|nr:hypothetical protein LSCM1_03774 [Leishmania martiniquensis]
MSSRATMEQSEGQDEADKASCGTEGWSTNPFRPCDFMACIPEPAYSVLDASTAAQSAAATGSITLADLASPAVRRVSNPPVEAAWYWRCPRSAFDARAAPDGESTEARHLTPSCLANGSETSHVSMSDAEVAAGSVEDAASGHLWMSLPAAVGHWNSACCFHHRLLLLRHMEERYSELNLLTGASLATASWTPQTAAAAAVVTLDSASSSNNVSRSIHSSIIDNSGTVSGNDSFDSISDTISDAAPRVVLSLTVQLYETVVLQGPTPRVSAKMAKKKTPGQTSATASRREEAHTCLANLTAPTVLLGLTWHAPRQWVQQRDAERVAASQRPTAGSFSTSSENTLHHSSTSASDIDRDVLAGRKKLPPQYHFVRAVSPTLVASAPSAVSPRCSGDTPVKLSAETLAKRKSAGFEGAPHEIPLRCGPGGCVYAAVPATSDSFTTTANGEAASSQFLLLLQMPLPFVEAFWVTLPSPFASRGSQCSGSAAAPDRRDEPSTSAIELRRVPWLPREACSLRAVELAVGAPISAAATLAASSGHKSASVELATLRGFVLEGPERYPLSNAMSTGFPRVFRALSAHDVLHARRAAVQRARVTRHIGEKDKPLSALITARKHEQAVKAAALSGHRRGSRDMHTSNSSTSSFFEDRRNGSITHSISSPPRNYAPATSFLDENFEPLTLLGRGVSGAVLLVRHRFTGVFYAIKVLIARDYESERDILQEMRVHAMLENRHVVRYHTCWSEVISATRAQQLAFIGVCHPYEANLMCRQRLESASSLSSPEAARGVARSGTWHSCPNSGQHIRNGSKLRCAPGAWHHLTLPSYPSFYLVGSDSASGTPSPRAKEARSHPRPRSKRWSTEFVEECADARGVEGDEAFADSVQERPGVVSERLRSSGTEMPSPPRERSQLSPHPVPLSSSPFVCDTHAPLTTHRLRKKPFMTPAFSSGSSAASDGVGGTTVQGVGDSEEEEAQPIWDDAQRGDSSSRSSSGSSDDGYGGKRQSGSSIIGQRVVFLQMELCQGTLAQYLVSRASVDRVENLIIIIQVMAGLRYLHRRGILHRDLKPTNVFLDYRCQYDKAAYQTDSSGTSDADEASSDDDHTANFCKRLTPPASKCGAAAAWGGQGGDEACATPFYSALTLCRRHSNTSPSELRLGGDGPSMSCAPRRTSIVPPGTQSLFPVAHSSLAPGWEAEKAKSLLDNVPSWDSEQATLDLVRGTPRRLAADMLRERLLRRPPPRMDHQRANYKDGVMVGEAASSNVPMPLVQGNDGRYFLRRLANWLLRRFVQVRLGDFGLAKFLYQQDLCVNGFVSVNGLNTIGVGSPLYASPEQLQGSRCTPASDAFSIGVMLAEMYLQPKTIAERLTVLREVREGAYPDAALLGQFPELKLVQHLTVTQPERRMTLAAAHRALKSFLERALHGEVRRHGD